MKPILQALVLAERIYEDKSGKKIIAGTFNQLHIGRVANQVTNPDGTTKRVLHGGTDLGSPSIYVSLTDVLDNTELVLQFMNVTTNTSVFQTGIRINAKDRLATVEFVVPLPAIREIIRGLGTYSFDLVWNGEILGSHRLVVAETPTPATENKGSDTPTIT